MNAEESDPDTLQLLDELKQTWSNDGAKLQKRKNALK